jgi:hypothetical protein
MALPSYDSTRPARPEGRTKVLGAGAPPPPPPVYPPRSAPPAPLLLPAIPSAAQSSIFSKSHSVSIMMPAPDGSMMAPLSQGPGNYVIVRRGKRHGPYDLAQLERLIPMGKLRSVDAIELQNSGEQTLAVDLPGLRPLFEARARAEEANVERAPAIAPAAVVAQPEDSRGTLWTVIGLLALGLVAVAVLLALQ